MRNKFVSLILGLMIILIAPALTTSCVDNAQKDKTEQAAFIQPEVSNLAYELTDVPPSQRVQCAGIFAFAQNEVSEDGTDAESQPVLQSEADEDTGVFGWQNILIAVLGIFSTLFASLWKRARSTLMALAAGLEDNNLTKAEIATIVNAWKGKVV